VEDRVAALALLLFFPAVAPAFQQKPGGAEGHVVDAGSGEPIRKAVVIFRTGPDGGVAAHTNAQRLFHFENLDPGVYTATASRDGYVADRKAPATVVTIQAEKTESDITLELVRTGLSPDGWLTRMAIRRRGRRFLLNRSAVQSPMEGRSPMIAASIGLSALLPESIA
jgi:hypothetical protein